MKPGATLGLSHGFLLGVMQNDGVDFRRDINVVLVAPKVGRWVAQARAAAVACGQQGCRLVLACWACLSAMHLRSLRCPDPFCPPPPST
jgi:hypothetical protein